VPIAFTPGGDRLVFGTQQWYSVPAAGGTPVPLSSFQPDPRRAKAQPGRRGLWFAGDTAYLAGRGDALFSAPLAGLFS
jgi:hypothetical protein